MLMPFVIATKRVESRAVPPGEGDPQTEAYRELTGAPVVRELTASVSCRAVATLEEAAAAAARSVLEPFPGDRDPLDTEVAHRVLTWDEQRPLQFPLPDGTVIEVEPVIWARLARDGGLTFIAAAAKRCLRGDEKSIAEVIAAYNAAQEAIER